MLSDHAVKHDEEFAHAGDEGDHFLFAGGAVMLVEGLDLRTAADGREGDHIKGVADIFPAAFDGAWPVGLATVLVVGRHAGEGGGLLAVERAEFGAGDDQGGGRVWSDARGRVQASHAGEEGGVGGDQIGQELIGVAELFFEGADDRVDALEDAGMSGALTAVLLLNEQVDELAAAAGQGAQFALLGRGQLRDLGLDFQGEEGQEMRVEGVGFGVLLEGLGEALGLQGRDDADGDLGVGALGGGVEFKSAGVFHDQQGDVMFAAESYEALPSGRVVGKVGLEDHLVKRPEDGQVQAFLAHVETRVGRE